MDLSKFYVIRAIWDGSVQKTVKKGFYEFKNTKNLNLAIQSTIGHTEGHEYALIYEKYRGGPCINIVVADPLNKRQILHKTWSYTYVRSVSEDTFNDIINFIKQ